MPDQQPTTGALPYNLQPPRPTWGVRLPPRKAQSTARPIAVCPLPREVAVPLDCGPAGVAEPLIAAGESVRTGQLIAVTADAGYVHATVSGEVLDVQERAVPGRPGAMSPCVLIRSDARDSWHPDCGAGPGNNQLDPARLRGAIAAAGIVGLGGALFPTADKMEACTQIYALILNGAECEPYISCDEMLMREQADGVIRGALLIMNAIGTDRTVIAVESDMPEARIALLDAIRTRDLDNIDVAVVTAKYPAGGERQLLELLTNRQVPAAGLPTDAGYLCQNVATAAAVANLVDNGQPLIDRIVTVTGAGVAEPQNLRVRIGTPLADLITAAGGYTTADCRLIMGGPMMGRPLPGDGLPVTKATNCIIVATPDELADTQAVYPCVRCGECSRACPARLLPQQLLLASRSQDTLALAELRLEACIECGCCDYVCPSHIDLTPQFVQAKRRLHQALGAQARAEQAKTRADAREERLRTRRSALAAYQEAELTTDDLAALMARVRAREQQRNEEE
ncbi:MAG: electron transport complex subunit RsxC [Gammaproteobacteria bacterium]|nr:electron transport complex subunit RsxC [Gammaproteobacteria bacterium]